MPLMAAQIGERRRAELCGEWWIAGPGAASAYGLRQWLARPSALI
jgi:hypothetical protein